MKTIHHYYILFLTKICDIYLEITDNTSLMYVFPAEVDKCIYVSNSLKLITTTQSKHKQLLETSINSYSDSYTSVLKIKDFII